VQEQQVNYNFLSVHEQQANYTFLPVEEQQVNSISSSAQTTVYIHFRAVY
jgi:hypothetical protein